MKKHERYSDVKIRNRYAGSTDIESYIFSSARHYALKLANKSIYPFSDLDDLEQEILALFYYQNKKHRHDPNKSKEKYWISLIMESIYKNLLNKKIIHSKHNSEYSLNDAVYNGNNNEELEPEILDLMEDKNADTFESYYKAVQREKLFFIIETLPEDLKEICRLLQEFNVTEISKKLNLSRKTIYQKINKIKDMLNGIDIT